MSEWCWPLPNYGKIVSGVGPRWEKQHKGIDIPAPRDTAIVASRDGKVVVASATCSHNYAKNRKNNWDGCNCARGFGNWVAIDHGDGYVTRYAHMTTIYAKQGATVKAGETIGTVGSTGHSTGNHLHFEIRSEKYNSSTSIIYDPEEYVSFDGTVKPTPPASQTDIASGSDNVSGSPASNNYSANDSSTVLPITTTNRLGGKPKYAYLSIYIGGVQLSYQNGKPSSIIDFKIDRLDNAGCKANFTLFDDNWDEIEYALATNYNDVSIQYGYSDGPMSRVYKMMLQDYSIDFMDTGTTLTINAISEAAYKNLEVVDYENIAAASLSEDTKDEEGNVVTNMYNPTRAIMAICEAAGWEVRPENFVATADVHRYGPYTLDNENPITYIQEVIVKEAKVPDSNAIVLFRIEEGGEKPIPHLESKEYGEVAAGRTYIYQKGYDSPVIDMSFYVKGIFGGTSNLSISSGLKSNSIDTETKEEYSNEETQQTVATTTTGIYSHMMTNQSIPTITFAGETQDQINNKLYYYVKNATTNQYEATMTIIGDPEIELLESIRVINVTDYGNLHHTSGVYLVMGISDSITNGEFRTTLKLIRNGDTDGIEILHPKHVVK